MTHFVVQHLDKSVIYSFGYVNSCCRALYAACYCLSLALLCIESKNTVVTNDNSSESQFQPKLHAAVSVAMKKDQSVYQKEMNIACQMKNFFIIYFQIEGLFFVSNVAFILNKK